MSELRKRGVAAAVICSEPFLGLGTAQARVFGVPDLPLLTVPHPIGGISLEKVQGRAMVAAPKLIEFIKDRMK